MELIVNNLPSKGLTYPFNSITINPMKFGQIMEYLDNCPDSRMEQFYFDYSIMKKMDENVDQLLYPDFEFCRFYFKALTISKNVEYDTLVTCSNCGEVFRHKVRLSDIKFEDIDESLLKVRTIRLSDENYPVKVPTIAEFLNVFMNYRKFKRETDFKVIEMIAMFQDAVKYPNKFEDIVVNAEYADVVALTMLHDLYYNLVQKLTVYCPHCNKVDTGEDLRGTAVDLSSLTADFFRDLLITNRVSQEEILS